MNLKNKALSVFMLAIIAVVAMPALTAASEGQVNINDASAEELAMLPRVGPVVSQRIVEFREANGEFATTEDLMLVAGIGERTFALIEPYITLEGDTTLTEKVRVARASEDNE